MRLWAAFFVRRNSRRHRLLTRGCCRFHSREINLRDIVRAVERTLDQRRAAAKR
jgi:hypothetical protein